MTRGLVRKSTGLVMGFLGQSRLTEELVEQGGCKVPARLFSVRGTGGFSQSRDQGVGSEI
jgi:hypothetical protein